jgi:hypothetical protein
LQYAILAILYVLGQDIVYRYPEKYGPGPIHGAHGNYLAAPGASKLMKLLSQMWTQSLCYALHTFNFGKKIETLQEQMPG